MRSDLIHVRIRGRAACWTRAEYRTERLSNVVGSHAAFEGLLSQIMGHKPCRYLIERVGLLFEPRRLPMTGNEIKDFGNGHRQVHTELERTLRTTALMAGKLREVEGKRVAGVDYVVSFRLNYSEIQYLKTLMARLNNGHYWGQPCLGQRDYPARVEHLGDLRKVSYPGIPLYEHPNGLKTFDHNERLGLCFYGTDWDDPRHPNYFATLDVVHGLVRYPSWSEVREVGIKRERAA